MNILGVSFWWYILIVLITLYLAIGIAHVVGCFFDLRYKIRLTFRKKWRTFLLPLALFLLIIGWLPLHIHIYRYHDHVPD